MRREEKNIPVPDRRNKTFGETRLWRGTVTAMIMCVILPISGWVVLQTVNAKDKYAKKEELKELVEKIEQGFNRQIRLQQEMVKGIDAINTKQQLLNQEMEHIKEVFKEHKERDEKRDGKALDRIDELERGRRDPN